MLLPLDFVDNRGLHPCAPSLFWALRKQTVFFVAVEKSTLSMSYHLFIPPRRSSSPCAGGAWSAVCRFLLLAPPAPPPTLSSFRPRTPPPSLTCYFLSRGYPLAAATVSYFPWRRARARCNSCHECRGGEWHVGAPAELRAWPRPHE